MATGPEANSVRLLPASPVFGRLIERIRELDRAGHKSRKWMPATGARAVSKLLDQATRLAVLQEELAGIEKTTTMAADLAPLFLQISDAAPRLHDLLDDFEYRRLRVEAGLEVRPSLLLPSFLLARSKRGKHFARASFEIGKSHGSSSSRADQSRLLDEFVAIVSQSRHLIGQLGKGKDHSNTAPTTDQILTLDTPDLIAATVPPKHTVFGRQDEKDRIVRSLIQSSDPLSVIPVVGRCGVGKTTLAQLVYNDTRVEQHFDLRIWVPASGASNKLEIIRDILQSVNPGYTDKMANEDIQTLQSELSRLVTSHRFLLVIDDLLLDNKMEASSKETWADIFAHLCSAEMGSSVLVTTPMMMLAQMLATSQPYVLGTLGKSECSALVMECALGSRNLKCSPELENIGKGIADKLQGLPLAAKVLGGVLGATRSPEEWRSIVDRKITGDVALHFMRLSYDFLPAKLKECFAYCALFPKNWKFERTKLIHLWMAEGFLGHQGDTDKTMEDLGSEYFDAFISLYYFQRHKQGSRTYFIMHHWFHDLAEVVSTNVCFRVEPGSTDEIPPTVRHLSITTDSPLDLNACCSLKQLRTLLILRSPLHSVQDNHLMKLRNLHVLDLCGCNIVELPEAIGELTHLRYLSLCGTLRKLPESVSRLLHLQILCFPKVCCLDKLPTGITYLVNLRYLDIDTKYIAKLGGIGRLVNLRGSVELHVEKGEGHILQDLRDIKDLRGQLKISGLDNVSTKEQARKAVLNNKQHLKILKLEWSSACRTLCHTADAAVLENLQPHPSLSELLIRRYGGSTAPRWLQIPLLEKLQSLQLINCRNLSVLPPLGQLPSLEKLHMKELCAVTHIGSEFYSSTGVSFPSLKVLELVDFPRLLQWSAEVNCPSFPCLKIVRIIDCPELVHIPTLPGTAAEVTIERICSIKRLRLAPYSTGSFVLTMDDCMTSVLYKGLFHQRHLESIAVLNINGGKLLATAEQLGSLISLQKLKLCQSDTSDHNFSLFLQALPRLSSLEMIDLPNITSFPVQADLNFFSTLAELHIRNCPQLSSLSSLQAFVSLKCLAIERCPRLTTASFPKNFGSLAFLKMLSISYCSQLQSLPMGSLPSSLQTLNLVECHPNLIEQSRNKKGYLWKVGPVPKVLIQ
ncbi:hypothetical protein EJB05_46980, partial [Eragrostis curvula]